MRVTKVQAIVDDDSNATTDSVSRSSTRRWTKDDLPFPLADRTTYTRAWSKHFQPTFLKWAGTVNDAFDTNAAVTNTVGQTWSVVFKTLPALNEEGTAAVVGNVRLFCMVSHFLSSLMLELD